MPKNVGICTTEQFKLDINPKKLINYYLTEKK